MGKKLCLLDLLVIEGLMSEAKDPCTDMLPINNYLYIASSGDLYVVDVEE